MKTTANQRKLIAFQTGLAAAALMSLLSACGGSATSDGTSTGAGGTTPSGGSSGGSGGSGGGSTYNGGNGGSTNNTTFRADLTYTKTLSGTDTYTTPSVTTDNLLKVRITAGAATTNIGSNFTANYNCIRYTVAGAGQSLQTDVLSVNGTSSSLCGSTEQSQVIDLSSSLSDGHGAIPITISGVQTSFRYQDCLNQPWNYGYMCNLYAPVYPQYEAVVSGKRVAQSATVKIEIMIDSSN